MPRHIYHVVPNRKGWGIKLGRRMVCIRATKVSAVSDAVSMAKSDWRRGHLAQVRVRGLNGKLQWERTYGKDPRRTKG